MLAGEAGELAKLTVAALKKSHQESTVRHPVIAYGYLGLPRQEYCQAFDGCSQFAAGLGGGAFGNLNVYDPPNTNVRPCMRALAEYSS
jgi:hypothetical protein